MPSESGAVGVSRVESRVVLGLSFGGVPFQSTQRILPGLDVGAQMPEAMFLKL